MIEEQEQHAIYGDEEEEHLRMLEEE